MMYSMWGKPHYFNKFTILLDRGGSGSYQSMKRMSDSNKEEESMADGKDKEISKTRIADEELEQAHGAEPVDDEALEDVSGGMRTQST